MDKLQIYTYVDGVNDKVFFDETHPIRLTSYKVSQDLMASFGITAKVKYPQCLDSHWNGLQYVSFGGERYFVQNTPSSEYSNEEAVYIHEITMVSEKDMKLSNVYFVDAVTSDTASDRYKSNSSDVVFFGDINEFVARLNASAKYSGLEYTFVVDEGVETEAKMVSFSDKKLLDAMKESYDIYNVPFYFIGKVGHFGHYNNVIEEPFRYGIDNELLRIRKQSAGKQIVRRTTGVGSGDNIPYYYPNNSPKGNIEASASASNTILKKENISILNYEKFANGTNENSPITYNMGQIGYVSLSRNGETYTSSYIDVAFDKNFSPFVDVYEVSFQVVKGGIVTINPTIRRDIGGSIGDLNPFLSNIVTDYKFKNKDNGEELFVNYSNGILTTNELSEGTTYSLVITYELRYVGVSEYKYLAMFGVEAIAAWFTEDKKRVDLHDIGIRIDVTPANGDSFNMKVLNKITPSVVLMPPIYRNTLGAERFYNAIDNTYLKEGSDTEYYTFKNQYNSIIPSENKIDREEIKPTIKGIKNASGQSIGQFLDVAFDKNDNDEQDAEGNYIHPYFFVKLPKFDGDFGFNLFDSASEKGEMSFSMTSGACGGCTFIVGVDNESQRNIVQVDDSGNLKRDKDGNVLWRGQQSQDRQNDTKNYEVWIALKKEYSTFGVIMPNATNNYKPAAGDSFVILDILLPQSYILAAESRLYYEILDDMSANNVDKFNFSIDFSRIYFAENPDMKDNIHENTKLSVVYDGKIYDFQVSSFVYEVAEDEALPKISITLSEEVVSRISFKDRYLDSKQTQTLVTREIILQPQKSFAASSSIGGSALSAMKVNNPLIFRIGEDTIYYNGEEEVDINIANESLLSAILSTKADKIHDHAGQLIRPKTFVVPQGEPTDLASGETALFLSPIGFNAETSGGGGGSNVVWDTSLYEGYAKLHVDTIAKDVAIWGHKHDDLYYTRSQSDELFATKNEIPSLIGYATKAWVLSKNYITIEALDPYAKKDGSNASGDWGINITGNAATADSAKSADDAKKLGGIVAANYYHAGNANKEDVNWTANKLKSKTLIIPGETPLNLAEGETAMFLSPVGFNAEAGGGGGGTDVMWESSTHSGYSKLNVGGIAKDVALWGHTHSEYALASSLLNYYTKTETGSAITDAINALDVASVGGSGKYISAISQTNGKISATVATMPSIVNTIGGYSGQISVGDGLYISSTKALGIADKGVTAAMLADTYIKDGNNIGTAYKRNFTLNNSSRAILTAINEDLTPFYAPTTAGSTGQVLQSTGGAPKWANISDIGDSRYVNKSGDTMSGDLTMTGHQLIWTDYSDNWNIDSAGLRIFRSGISVPGSPGNYYVGLNAANGDYKFQLAAYGGCGTYLGFRNYNSNNGTWSDWVRIWHSGNGGSGSGLDADLLDGQHGEWYRRNGLRFTRTTGTSTAGGYDANTLIGKGGIMVNMSSYLHWANTPEDMQIGSVFHIEADNYALGAAQFAWDTTANSSIAPTKRLWFRAANNVGFAKDWKEIWHSGTSNRTDTDWACKNLRMTGDILSDRQFTIAYNDIEEAYLLTSQTNGNTLLNSHDGNNLIFGYKGTSALYFYGGITEGNAVGSMLGIWSATGLGIGKSPTAKLDVDGNAKALKYICSNLEDELIALDITNTQYNSSFNKSSSIVFRSQIADRYGKIKAVMESYGVFNRFAICSKDTDISEKEVASVDKNGKFKCNTLLIPTNPPTDLGAGETAIFLSPIGFSYSN